MKVEWLGHACFAVESGGYRIVLDPYRDVQGYADVNTAAHEVLCSHGHFDHAHREGVAPLGGKKSPFTIRTIPAFHDPEGGVLRGENLIHVLSAEGLTVVHLGDLGHSLSPEQLAAVGPCDALLIPIGGTYTINTRQAKALVDEIAPRVTIPMHYRHGNLGFDVLESLEDFLALCPPEVIRYHGGNTLELAVHTPAQVAVLHH